MDGDPRMCVVREGDEKWSGMADISTEVSAIRAFGDRLSQTLNKNENEKGETDEQDEHEEVHGQHL